MATDYAINYEPEEAEIDLCLDCPLPECIETDVRDDWTIAPRAAHRGARAPTCPWIQAGYYKREYHRFYKPERRRRDPEFKARNDAHSAAWRKAHPEHVRLYNQAYRQDPAKYAKEQERGRQRYLDDKDRRAKLEAPE